MDELIEQILDVESRAQEIVKDAREASSELDERVTLDGIKLENDLKTKAREKNEAIRDMEKSEADERINDIGAAAEKSISAIEERYRQNKELWVSRIVGRVIGGKNEQ